MIRKFRIDTGQHLSWCHGHNRQDKGLSCIRAKKIFPEIFRCIPCNPEIQLIHATPFAFLSGVDRINLEFWPSGSMLILIAWDRRSARWSSGRVRYVLCYALHNRCLDSVFDPEFWRTRKSSAKVIAIPNLRAREGGWDDGGYGYRSQELANSLTAFTVTPSAAATRAIIEPLWVYATQRV